MEEVSVSCSLKRKVWGGTEFDWRVGRWMERVREEVEGEEGAREGE